MPQVEASIVINRPVSEVFRLAGNFNNAKQWQPDVVETYQSDDHVRVGVMVTQRRSTRLLGWQLDLNVDITGYQPNRMIEYKGVLGRFPVNGQLDFESGGGKTTVRETMNIRMGFLFGIFSPMLRSVMMRRTNKALQTLKTQLETHSPGSSSPTDFHNQL